MPRLQVKIQERIALTHLPEISENSVHLVINNKSVAVYAAKTMMEMIQKIKKGKDFVKRIEEERMMRIMVPRLPQMNKKVVPPKTSMKVISSMMIELNTIHQIIKQSRKMQQQILNLQLKQKQSSFILQRKNITVNLNKVEMIIKMMRMTYMIHFNQQLIRRKVVLNMMCLIIYTIYLKALVFQKRLIITYFLIRELVFSGFTNYTEKGMVVYQVMIWVLVRLSKYVPI